jgi:hypothetical protein
VNRTRLSIASALALGFLISVALCAEKPPEKPKPIVTITQTDGADVRGRLMTYDNKTVTLETIVKSGEGESIVVEWARIKSVSSGLTLAKAQQEWKAKHRAGLCETCHGNQRLRCDVCHGTGHDHASSKDCPTCHGAGELKCSAPKCTNGKIPCPGKCVKLTEGTWVKRDDGKRWRTIAMPGHVTLDVPENRIGEIWEQLADGTPVGRGKCPICSGATELDCLKCDGLGMAICPTCVAKENAPDCPACDGGWKACADCKGTGIKPPK